MFSAEERFCPNFGAYALWNKEDYREISSAESFDILLKNIELCYPKWMFSASTIISA
jgi:hypothetical protein